MSQFQNPGQFQPPPAGSLDGVLDDVDNSERMASYLDKLPVGNHTLLFDYYGGRPTRKTGIMIEAEFVVEASDTLAPNSRRGWAWFPNKGGDAAAYEKDRVVKFCSAIDGSLGIAARSTKDCGRHLVNQPNGAPSQLRGLRIQAQVFQRIDRKTGMPAAGPKGPYLDVLWSAVPQQNAETIAANVARMPAQLPRSQPAQQAQHAPQYAPPQPPPQYPQQGYAPQPQASAYPHPGMAPQGYPQPPAMPAGYPAYGQPAPAQPAPAAPAPGQPNFVAGIRGGS